MDINKQHFNFIPYNQNLKEKAKENRKNPTKPEIKIWNELLRKKFIDYKFLRQKPINNFILDFYCSKLLFAIEIDGDSHYKDQNYDFKRTNILNNLGIKIIRYTNLEIMKNIEGVYLNLMEEIRLREKELKPSKSPLSGRLEEN
ncbi:MAG: endonuclease domain-containing protein [Candidatus Kuenenbacteria bacterium]